MKKFLLIYFFFLLGSEASHAQSAAKEGGSAGLGSCSVGVGITNSSPILCYGDSAKFTASAGGGTAPYTYVWTPSTGLNCSTCKKVDAAPSSNTTYTLHVTDKNGCPATATVTVDINPRINLSVLASSYSICKGDTVYLNSSASGGTPPYTYSWTPAAALNNPAIRNPYYVTTVSKTFTCKVTDQSGCFVKDSIHIIVNPKPVFNAATNLENYLLGDSLSATGGVPPYTYTFAPTITYFTPPTGITTYTLTVTGANGCSSIDTARYTPALNTTAGACGSIFVAEYIQDTANHDDAIELYNPTAAPINLSTYCLFGTTNGALLSLPFLIKLHGTIKAHKTFLIANTNADTALTNHANMLSDSLNFGGSDIVVLAYMKTVASSVLFTLLDEIGSDSIPPTSNGWTVGTGSTKNHTLLRQSNVTQGDINWVTCKSEWRVYKQGTFNHIEYYNNVCTPKDAELYLTLGNDSVSCGNPGYFSFDVMVQADSAKIFNDGIFKIAFPENEFAGDNIYDGSIQYAWGPDFQYDASKNDYSPPSNVQSGNVIYVQLGSTTGISTQGTVIDTIPKVLFHFSLKIQNSCQTGTIYFDSTAGLYTWQYASEDSTFLHRDSTVVDSMCCPDYHCPYQCDSFPCNKHCCMFDIDSNCTDSCYDICYNTCYDTCYQTIRVVHYYNVYSYGNYSNVDYSKVRYMNSIPTSSCGLSIDPIPDPINAGTNSKSIPPVSTIPDNSSILTITGTGFGNTKGNIKVPDANTGGVQSVMLDSTDILSWSENLIKIKMPSTILNNSAATPGSGPIQVNTSCGSASANLQINYNIENNYYPGYGKFRPNIVMVNDTESIKFRCDTSITNNPPAFACVKKAMTEWNCYTGVNWKLGPTIILDTSVQDNVSVIYFSNWNFTPRTYVMYTQTWPLQNCIHSSDSVNFRDEADIEIKRNQYLPGGLTWYYDTTTAMFPPTVLSFYDLITHELGHALGLGHINDSTSVMYYKARPGYPRVGILSGSTFPGPASLEGGLDVVNTSAAYSPSYCSDSILIPSLRYCIDHTLSVPDIPQQISTLNLFPNPINNGNLTITYHLSTDSYIQFRIQDCVGRVVMKLNDEHKTVGEYSQQINIDALAGGVYLFTANINGECQTIKFIKL